MKNNRELVISGLIGMMCGILIAVGGMYIKESSAGNSNVRNARAIVTEKYYYESDDCISIEFTDETGNTWIVTDCECDFEEEYLLTFDTKGTENIEDDEIVSIGEIEKSG